MQSRQIKVAVSLVMIAAAAVTVAFRYYRPLPKLEPGPHLGIGQSLAERAAKLLQSGGRIILITPDTQANRFPGAAIQLKAFHEALQRAGLSVAATNIIKLDPNRVTRAPPGDFADILRKNKEADVVVSLLGPPVLSPEQKTRVGEKHPKVVAVCSGDMPRQIKLRPLFADNLLHAAILSRPSPSPNLPASGKPADWFSHFFLWITPENVIDLPDGGGK